MELTKVQTEFLNRYVDGTWNLNSKGFVDVNGDFKCCSKNLKSFKGIKFGKISGSFECNNNQLTSLEGAPQKVGGDFDCSGLFEEAFEKAFEIIYEKMEGGMSYGVALLVSKSKISKAHWNKLDKSSIERMDPKEVDNIEKGASILSRIGIF
jgi:hypothetical protein